MIEEILADAPLSIIERGSIKEAHRILKENKYEIIDSMNENYEKDKERIKKYFATILTIIVQKNDLYDDLHLNTISDFLSIDYDTLQISGETIGDEVSLALYDVLLDAEAGTILFYLGDYSRVILDSSEECPIVLTDVFEEEFTKDTLYNVLSNPMDYVESVGWAELTIADIVEIGLPYAEDMKIYCETSLVSQYSKFRDIVKHRYL